MNQQQLEKYLGPRGEHYHGGMGDAGCFSVCPVWDWDLRARTLQGDILDAKIELLEWALAGAAPAAEHIFVKAIDDAKAESIKFKS